MFDSSYEWLRFPLDCYVFITLLCPIQKNSTMQNKPKNTKRTNLILWHAATATFESVTIFANPTEVTFAMARTNEDMAYTASINSQGKLINLRGPLGIFEDLYDMLQPALAGATTICAYLPKADDQALQKIAAALGGARTISHSYSDEEWQKIKRAF